MSEIPYNNLASGIEHGPYEAASEAMVQHYVSGHRREVTDATISDEQLTADVESEWQYDQHGEAVMEALKEGRISGKHAYHMIGTVLRPWWIGHRNPGDKPS